MRTKKVTIKDVAEKAGVSISIVSYVLNDTPGKTIPETTRNKVIQAARELDYSPNAIARGMRMKKTMAIGLVSFWDIAEPVFASILKGVSTVAAENGYSLVFCNLNKKEREFDYVEFFKRAQIDGVLLISPPQAINSFNEGLHVETIKKYKIPAVILNGYTEDPSLSYIYIDYYNTTYMAVEYLARLGHKKVGYILPESGELSHSQARDRLKGFKDAVSDFALEKNEDFIFGSNEINKIIEMVNDNEAPTALVASKCPYAQRFIIEALKSKINIPEQISIIAANTEPYAPYLYPPLTTVQLPLQDIGERSAAILCETIDKKISQFKLKLPNKISERASCREL